MGRDGGIIMIKFFICSRSNFFHMFYCLFNGVGGRVLKSLSSIDDGIVVIDIDIFFVISKSTKAEMCGIELPKYKCDHL